MNRRIIIGSVRASQDRNTCRIGNLVVHPDYQNHGIGTKLLKTVENSFKNAGRYELFTGYKSKRNLYLYAKNGYKIFKEEQRENEPLLVFMEKRKDG